MKRNEVAVASLAAIVGAALVLAVVEWEGWLANGRFASASSNLLGLLAAPAIIAGVATAAWDRWHDRCASPRCIRRGKHPVDGCTRSVCDPHHTEEHHRAAFRAFHVPGRLGWGQSHRS